MSLVLDLNGKNQRLSLSEIDEAQKKIRECVEVLSKKNKEIVITIQPLRTLKMNNALWRTYEFISQQAYVSGKRYSRKTWHHFFKERFGLYEHVLVNGQRTIKEKSTSEYTVEEFIAYLTAIQAEASVEYGVVFDGSVMADRLAEEIGEELV